MECLKKKLSIHMHWSNKWKRSFTPFNGDETLLFIYPNSPWKIKKNESFVSFTKEKKIKEKLVGNFG